MVNGDVVAMRGGEGVNEEISEQENYEIKRPADFYAQLMPTTLKPNKIEKWKTQAEEELSVKWHGNIINSKKKQKGSH